MLKGESHSAVSTVNVTRKWHSRLGHLSQKGLDLLVKEGYLESKDIDMLGFCEDCVLGKAQKQSFKKGKHTSKGTLDYVHSNLWGAPTVIPSLAEKQYFITFIDDYSRKVWIYFLRTKDEEIYMDQPEGYVTKGKEDLIFLLKKSLYGLKQSPRQWNKRFDGFMKEQGFRRSPYDQCVYISGVEMSSRVYLLLYVDDMLVVSKDMEVIRELKARLSSEFEMKDLGAATRILGMDIVRDRKAGTLKLSQGKYLEQVHSTFNMTDCKAVTTPMGFQFRLKSLDEDENEKEKKFMVDVPYASAVGSLMYAMVGTRPDIAHAVGVVSRFMGNSGREHWEAVKWILRYVKGTTDYGLWFTKGTEFKVDGYCDADFASDRDRSRSVTGYLFQVGGNTISWRSGLQPIVGLSTTESEYMSLTEGAKEALWLKGVCEDLKYDQGAVKINCDSQSAIFLAKNGGYHERTKHIHRKFNFIRDVIGDGSVSVVKVHTSLNLADILTKSVPGKTLEKALVLVKVRR